MLITKIREYIRKSGYLKNSKLDAKHTSIDGKTELYENLVNFAEIAQNNFQIYLRAQKSDDHSAKMNPVSVTQGEFEESR